jgi:cytochrome c
MVGKYVHGKPLAVEIVKTAKEKGHGDLDYIWRNPKTNAVEGKNVTFEKVDDVIICCE